MEAERDWLGLRDRACVVTGAAGGIGRVIARNFAELGAKVVMIDRETAQCEAAAAGFGQHRHQPVALSCNVADPESVASVAARARELVGPADVLVNNAAILKPGPILTVSAEDWNALVAVNLNGYLFCAQQFAAQMIERKRGALIHIASISGYLPQSYSGAYSASKAGVLMLSQQLAVELGEYGVRSNVVSPAMLITPISEAFYANAKLRAQREAIVPLRRIGTPQDIADAVVFFASDRSHYISGEDVLVDGAVSRSLLGLFPRPGFDRADHVALDNKS
jgi:glucose 1-dehydrogenase